MTKSIRMNKLEECSLIGSMNNSGITSENHKNLIHVSQAFGQHDIMVMAAHRYCLGRRTYIVSICVDWLKQNWHLLCDQTRKQTIEETREAINGKWAGDNCDNESWLSLIKFHEDESWLKDSA